MHVYGMLNSVETVVKEIDRFRANEYFFEIFEKAQSVKESICLPEPRPTSSRRKIKKAKRFLNDEERNLNSL